MRITIELSALAANMEGARSPALRIATMGVGYTDGYPRALSNCAFAAHAGHRTPLVGRVSMDLLPLDVSAALHAKLAIGDHVDLIGGGAPLEGVVPLADAVNCELLASWSRRAQGFCR